MFRINAVFIAICFLVLGCTPQAMNRELALLNGTVTVNPFVIQPTVISGPGVLTQNTSTYTLQPHVNETATVVQFSGGVPPYDINLGTDCAMSAFLSLGFITNGFSVAVNAAGTCTVNVSDSIQNALTISISTVSIFGATQTLTSVPTTRANHTATLLSNGKVLIVGGEGASTEVDLYDPNGNGGAGSYTTLTPLLHPRYFHTATLLANGTVLIVGGGRPLTQVDLGVTVPLAGGGDISSAALNNVELYDPSANGGTGSTTEMTHLNLARSCHTATLLGDGRVLIVGGAPSNANTTTATVEVYTPSANAGLGSTTTLTSLSVARADHSATLLASGNVLIAGGSTGSVITNSVELYNPASTGSTSVLTPLLAKRHIPATVLLASGKVLFLSGNNGIGGGGGPNAVGSNELYDPSGTGSSMYMTSLNTPSAGGVAIPLSNGEILIAGGYVGSGGSTTARVEIYNPTGNGGFGISTTIHSISTAGAFMTGTLLPSGNILFTGGFGNFATGPIRNLVEVYSLGYQ